MRALARGIGDAETSWLVLIGEGPDDAMLRREASRLGVTKRVLFLTPQWDPVELLPAMQLFLIPSNFERLPVTLIDAMLAGLPVVSSPWEGYGEFLTDGETGFVATDWSQEAFAEAILRALADPARLRRVADRARTFALERFDMDPAARRLANLYRTLAWKKRI
jgi:glycosyltransferase involved in cell wall biosynthesis